jgi:AraC-like DNA-binding protein
MNAIYEKKLNYIFPIKTAIMFGNDAFPYHWHEMVEILYSKRGSFNIAIEDKIYKVDQSETVIIAGRKNHCLLPSDGSSKRICIHFAPNFFFSLYPAKEHKNWFSQINPHSKEWPLATQKKVAIHITTIHKEYRSKACGWHEMICSKLFEMLSTLMREIPSDEDGNDNKIVDKMDNAALKKVIEYLSENFAKDITLEKCADDLGYNKSYLSTLFKNNTGITFSRYLRDLRLGYAEWLLQNDELCIKDLAERSGFKSIKTFYRVFKNKYGTSPKQYVLLHKSEWNSLLPNTDTDT